jgi:glycosyltransferase involved in cell wall biosynthesis
VLDGSDILFVGVGKSSVLWYRCALPAMALGADWIGVRGRPPGPQVVTGEVRGPSMIPRFENYRVVIFQQVYGREWLAQINSLRERKIKVLYEIDDYLHGVSGQTHHGYAKHFTKQRLQGHELCMRACDGIICSTDYIARRYAKFNRSVYVCAVGLDVARYALTRPERPTVNVLWAGATGHLAILLPWLNAMLPVFKEHANTCFVSVGNPQLATAVGQLIGSERAIGIPFCPIECYPAAMMMGDIALAPAGKTAWYRGKSDLRWLEASALGIPVIADPVIYPEIEHGVTGFHAATPPQMADILRTLIVDGELRERVGEAAREHVLARRTSEIAATQWYEVCCAVAGEYESMHQLVRAGR